MKILTHTIQDSFGLHARPATRIVDFCKKSQSKITLYCGDRSADCTRLFAVLAAGIQHRETVRFQIEGPDENEVYHALQAYILENGV